MGVRIIDLSLPLENFASEPYPPQISYYDHKSGARRLAKLAGVEPSDFPGGIGLASESVTASTHSGTHVDAPWHYGPTSEGCKSRAIDSIPLEWCYGDCVVLDVRHKAPGSEITAGDIRDALKKIEYTLKERDVVLLQTGADRYWGSTRYMEMYPGLGREGTAWLLEKGVRCIGIDAWGLDIPVRKMAESIHNGEDKSKLWAAHFYGRNKEYLQIEKLANLDKIPEPYGFTICVFPVKIADASAGWCRAVAIINNKE